MVPVTALSPSDARTITVARDLLDRIWDATYPSTEAAIKDFGRLEVAARSLLDVISHLTDGHG